nr:hypothetical protein [Clostridioides difficile]
MLSLFWGFRLTKWNVNCTISFFDFTTYKSFRLTKWNVNLKFSSLPFNAVGVLD